MITDLVPPGVPGSCRKTDTAPVRQKLRTVVDALAQDRLRSLFQPIVNLSTGQILGYEGLIRGPEDGPWDGAEALFQAALAEGVSLQLELACAARILHDAAATRMPGRFFLNMSAQALTWHAEREGLHGLLGLAERAGLPAGKLVIEVTEHERVADIDGLRRVSNALRARGVAFALDDFGDGRSSLRLWAELEPNFVKIDKYFTRAMQDHPAKIQTLRALRQIAETFNTRLVAEGLEDARSLAIARDLGIEFGQGYFLGRPVPVPAGRLDSAAAEAIEAAEVAVLGGHGGQSLRSLSMERMLIEVEPIRPRTRCEDVLARLRRHPDLDALPVVEDGKPVGLINRRDFIEYFTQPYRLELHGRKPCSSVMDAAPRLIERSADGEEILAVLTSDDQRYLSDGFIITDGGRYCGIGSGQQLVRSVSEHRIEAARHANPLTLLPGNIPISDHIDRLLRSRRSFTAAYLDLRHFKPFNDVYGYWRGDEMIRLLASIVLDNVDPRRDFVGHVGGDDFVVLFQSPDWEPRSLAMIAQFGARARHLYDAAALEVGGIEAEDRLGNPAFFPLSSLTVGVVHGGAGRHRRVEEVGSAAAAAKRVAKRTPGGLYIAPDDSLLANMTLPASAQA